MPWRSSAAIRRALSLGGGRCFTPSCKRCRGFFVAVIIITGILTGIFTATESAAVAVIYALVVTIFVYRALSWQNLVKAAAKAAKTTGVVLLLIGVSTVFGYLISLYDVAQLASEGIAQLTTNPLLVFFLINLILFVLGTFLDMAATILICTPLFLPIAMQYGMGPVQFGMVMLINCALGLNTPPVGTTQFVGCAIGEVSVGHVMKTIWPFYLALVGALFLVTYVPAFSLALPRWLVGLQGG
ncbi:TRAP transporter large permease subunit [Elstera litoralis]|uniref:TRAP transporter large permease subunit n=1 Tax=Elstera litoralis TaxID=552518 RepID=UPI0022B6ADF9|nr:TRAP transporter large permease subunit [Elstera litoralis]